MDLETNLWLHELTNDIKDSQYILGEYVKHEHEALYEAVMDVVVRANRERFEGDYMCDALREIMKDSYDAAEAKGDKKGEARCLISDVENVMKNFKVSLADACASLERTVAEYDAAKKLIQ